VPEFGRRAAVTLLCTLVALLSSGTPVSAAPASRTGRYYVVARLAGGQREYLYEIAVKTLHDGNRYEEIFTLNKGRVQPDGGRLTDPLRLSPGWILILPKDAEGPGVHSGPLPKVTATATDLPSPVASSAPPEQATRLESKEAAIRLGGVAVAFLLLIAAVAVLRGGRRRADRARQTRLAEATGAPPGPPGAAAPAVEPPRVKAPEEPKPLVEPQFERPARLRPPGESAIAGAAAPSGTGSPSGQSGPDPSGVPAPGPPVRLAATDWPSSREGRPGADRPERGEPPPPVPAGRRPYGGNPAAKSGVAASSKDTVPGHARPDISSAVAETAKAEPAIVDTEFPSEHKLPGPARQGPGSGAEEGEPSDTLTAELVTDGNRIAVSLAGAADTGRAAAFGWRDAGQAPPVGTLPVLIGEDGGRELFLDLGRCPDVLTIVGDLPDCEKHALRLVRQMLAGGNGVAVLGEQILVDALPVGGRRVEAMDEVRDLDSAGIVICGRLAGADLAAARVARSAGGPTPVIIGDVPRSRWSLVLQPQR
jgi:hypothetical protein